MTKTKLRIYLVDREKLDYIPIMPPTLFPTKVKVIKLSDLKKIEKNIIEGIDGIFDKSITSNAQKWIKGDEGKAIIYGNVLHTLKEEAKQIIKKQLEVLK